MKTTMELPTQLLRKVKATAAKNGQSMTAFVTAALESKLAKDSSMTAEKPWMRFAGLLKNDTKESRQILKTIEKECGSVRMEDWQ